eukprot:366391-Chlamydomonas_euryale.AAC.7
MPSVFGRARPRRRCRRLARLARVAATAPRHDTRAIPAAAPAPSTPQQQGRCTSPTASSALSASARPHRLRCGEMDGARVGTALNAVRFLGVVPSGGSGGGGGDEPRLGGGGGGGGVLSLSIMLNDYPLID